MISKQQIKFINSLKRNKNRLQSNCFISEGVNILEDLFKSDFSIETLFATKEWSLKNPTKECNIINLQALKKISSLKSPNDVLAIVTRKNYLYNKSIIQKNKKIILLDNISDPGNMGTIIRTADWFGYDHIFVSNKCVDCYNPKVVQSSMGSIFRVSISKVNPLDFLLDTASLGIKSFGASLSGENIYDIIMPDKYVMVFGSESHGISIDVQSMLDEQLSIPSNNDSIDSLNVSVAFGIILSEIR
jgi:TrmH family RNA methyltransferase